MDDAMSDSFDADIIEQARANSSDESELFSFLRARLTQEAKWRIGGARRRIDKSKLQMDADDIAQETMITIYEKYKTEKDIDHRFIPWAIQILKNKIGNYLQKEIPKGEREIGLDAEMKDQPRTTETEEKIATYFTLKELESAILKMTDICKRILLIFLNGGKRPDVLKEFSGAEPPMTINTIDSNIHRCREALKRKLIKDEILYDMR